MLGQQRAKQEGIPMSGLVSKLKDVSGLMPVLKRVVEKQVEIELILNRFMENSKDFLT